MVSRLKRIGKWLAVTAGLGGLAIVLSIAALWLQHNSSLELPRPTGPFEVGRVSTTWIDTTRADPFAPAPAPQRELVVWIWYPAEHLEGAKAAEYLPAAWQRAVAEQTSPLLTQFMWRNPAKIHGHSVENVDVASAKSKYPVIILRSGIGALAIDYTTIAEDLASHGYIVVSADAPYSTYVVVMPDGRVIHRTFEGNPGDAPMSDEERVRRAQTLIEVWIADTRFLLDQIARMNESDAAGKFTGKIDLDAVGIAGHSFGGATAAQICHDDSRCRAGIDIDGRLYGREVQEGIEKPFLFLLSDHGDWSKATPPDSEILADIRSVATHSPADKLMVTMLGAQHFSFGDQSLTQSQILRSMLVTLSGRGGLDPRTGLAMTCRYMREFFDVHLRGAPRDALYSGPLVAGVRLEASQ